MEPSINCHDLILRLGDDETLVVDCRDETIAEEYYDEMQIPGALRMGYDELSECAHILPDDELIVLYGCAPDSSDSRKALRLLRMRGRDAVCLQGGLPAWIARGYPTERYVSRSERVARRQMAQGQEAVASGEG